jgi:hypothetical protein
VFGGGKDLFQIIKIKVVVLEIWNWKCFTRNSEIPNRLFIGFTNWLSILFKRFGSVFKIGVVFFKDPVQLLIWF